MRCQECKGILFIFDKQIEKDKTQQEAIGKYFKNIVVSVKSDKNKKGANLEKYNVPKKFGEIEDLENVTYAYKNGIIEIIGKDGVIGNLILKCDVKIDKRYGCQSGMDAFVYPLGNARFENNQIKIYIKDKYLFAFEEFSQDKEKQALLWEILKKNLDKNIINRSILLKDLENAEISSDGGEILVKKEDKVILQIYLKCVFEPSPEVFSNLEEKYLEEGLTIGFAEKIENKIQIFYESAFPDVRSGEIICSNCGAVIEPEIIDTGAEWRSFDTGQKEKRSRASGAIKDAKVSKGLTTEIDRYDRDAKGGGFEAERKVELYRMRRLQTRSRMSDSVGRNLSIALPELDRMCSLLNIGETIKEYCAHLYRQAVDKGFVKGRSIESIIGAIIYYVTKMKGEPRTLKEIGEKSGVSKKEIGRSYKHILRCMNLKSPKTNVEDYISLYALKIGISNAAEKKAQEIFKEIKNSGITSGRDPSGIAGAIISLACDEIGEEFPEEKLLKLAKITNSTLHNRVEEIKSKLKKLIKS